MTPEQILTAQADLVARLGTSDFNKYLHGAISPNTLRQGGEGQTEAIIEALKGSASVAYAYRVSEDMCSLVEWAASQLENEDRFHKDMAPTGAGFVKFERALPVQDVRGQTMLIDYLVWGPALVLSAFGTPVPAVALWAFNDMERNPDEVSSDLRKRKDNLWHNVHGMIGRWGYIGTDVMSEGEKAGPRYRPPSESYAAQMLAEGITAVETTNVGRYVMALWMLMDQKVTESPDVTGQISKKAQRKHGKKIPGKIRAVRLRRSPGNRGSGESRVEWSHRWVVRGHWRWQAYGPGREERRRIWVSPFIKGPAGKPLLSNEKVYDLK